MTVWGRTASPVLVLSFSSLLRSVPNRQDDHVFAMDSVEHDVRRPTNNQFTYTGFCARTAQVGMISKCLDYGNDARG